MNNTENTTWESEFDHSYPHGVYHMHIVNEGVPGTKNVRGIGAPITRQVKDWIRTKKALWENDGQLLERAWQKLHFLQKKREITKEARTLALQEAASAVRGMKIENFRRENKPFYHKTAHNQALEDAAREIESKINK